MPACNILCPISLEGFYDALCVHFIQRGIPEVTHEPFDDDRRGSYNGNKIKSNKVRSSCCAL